MPVTLTVEYLLASVLFALALTGRSVCNVGFIERPLVLGFLWGLYTGEYGLALPLAVFFELFWLDLFPIGSYLPPMPAFPYLILMSFAGQCHWDTPSMLAFPLALLLPLAYIPPYIEARQRFFQTAGYARLMHRARHQAPLGSLPGRILLSSIMQHYVFGLAAFVGVLILMVLLTAYQNLHQAEIISLNLDWPVLYGIAAIGSLMALRVQRAYVVFALCMFFIMVHKAI